MKRASGTLLAPSQAVAFAERRRATNERERALRSATLRQAEHRDKPLPETAECQHDGRWGKYCPKFGKRTPRVFGDLGGA